MAVSQRPREGDELQSVSWHATASSAAGWRCHTQARLAHGAPWPASTGERRRRERSPGACASCPAAVTLGGSTRPSRAVCPSPEPRATACEDSASARHPILARRASGRGRTNRGARWMTCRCQCGQHSTSSRVMLRRRLRRHPHRWPRATYRLARRSRARHTSARSLGAWPRTAHATRAGGAGLRYAHTWTPTCSALCPGNPRRNGYTLGAGDHAPYAASSCHSEPPTESTADAGCSSRPASANLLRLSTSPRPRAGRILPLRTPSPI